MSRSTFAKRFTDAYGSGPMELLRGLRIRLAASLLGESEFPVKRIAELVGFRCRNAFTRTFETIAGTPPRAFRAEMRAGRRRGGLADANPFSGEDLLSVLRNPLDQSTEASAARVSRMDPA